MAEKGQRQALTARMIAAATCPPSQPQARLWDAVQPGLLVRVYPSGSKAYWVRYRAAGKLAWYKLGDVDGITLDAARKAASVRLGQVAAGADPAAERREERRAEQRRLAAALDAYERSLETRGAVKAGEVLSLLRRELLGALGDIDVDDISLGMVVKRVNAIRPKRPGTAKELRTRAGVFLAWCASEGLIKASPMAGYRLPRQTRQQRLAEAAQQRGKRALADPEIPAFWQAADAAGWPFGRYLQILLLLGQRRTETALMTWRAVDLERALWTIPAEDTKSGRAHQVPLSRQAVEIIAAQPKLAGSPYVFPGRTKKPLNGWSKRLAPVYRLTAEAGVPHWTLHDLRRSARTGMTALGIESDVAEMMLNHQIGDDLRRVYDRHGYPEKRAEAAQVWADHVFRLIGRGAP